MLVDFIDHNWKRKFLNEYQKVFPEYFYAGFLDKCAELSENLLIRSFPVSRPKTTISKRNHCHTCGSRVGATWTFCAGCGCLIMETTAEKKHLRRNYLNEI